MSVKLKATSTLAVMIAAAGLTACGGDSNSGIRVNVPSTYQFDSKFEVGESSVSYSGQIARQVLISELNYEINTGLQQRVDAAEFTADANTATTEALAILNSYYTGGTDVLNTNALMTVPGNALQQTFGAISLDKKLQDKIAGNDSSTDHKDWDNGDFVGWTAASPDALIGEWFQLIAENTADEVMGSARSVDFTGTGSGTGAVTLKIYQTDDGLDLKQLVQKFLLGAVNFSQGTDDYLDDATAAKGLLTSNAGPSGVDSPYSTLEHQFDEGFGYFGAAINYNDYTDEEIAGSGGRVEFADGYNDFDEDGLIDLLSEFNFGHSTNAAKRDIGSTTGTDFSKAAFDAFLTGRAIISKTAGRELTESEASALATQRDIIVENWEKAISATVVHYINDVLADMDTFGTVDYSYADHIKHWAEMKGFALGLQFNPRSPLNEGTLFADFHALVGERPVLPDAAAQDISDYEQALLDARDLLESAYGFANADVVNW